MPKVSIIIPAYNTGDLIIETLGSVFALEHHDLEVIVVDDGSTDNTCELVGAMAGVRLIAQANAGDSAARNTGLAASSGEYIMFLDHDDLLLPSAATDHLACLAASADFDMVVGSNYLINAQGEPIGENPLATRRFSGRDVALGLTPSFSQCMYRRSALERIGGFRPSATVAADHDLNLRLLGFENRGFVHGKMVMKYRLHEGQQTKSPARLYRAHMDALARLLGAGGALENTDLHAEALSHWQRYYGKFLPSEVGRMLLLGKPDKALSAAALFARTARHSVPSTLDYWFNRLRRARHA